MTVKVNTAAIVVAAVVISSIINIMRIKKMRKQSDEIDRQRNAAANMFNDKMRKQMDKDLESFI